MIPKEALQLIASGRTWQMAHGELVQKAKSDILDLKTFGFVTTPIQVTATGEIVGYVIVWANHDVTTVDADGNLLGIKKHFGYTTPEQAVQIFDECFACDKAKG